MTFQIATDDHYCIARKTAEDVARGWRHLILKTPPAERRALCTKLAADLRVDLTKLLDSSFANFARHQRMIHAEFIQQINLIAEEGTK